MSLAKNFFPKGDLSQLPLVSKKSFQSWLLNEAGLALLNIGRPKEAEEPFLIGVQMYIESKDWENASAGYQNLADLQFRMGGLDIGLKSAKKALKLSEKAKSNEDVAYSKAYIAWILHLLGKNEDVDNLFRQVDKLSWKIFGHQDFSITGIFYTDFLLSTQKPNKALKLTLVNLKICQEENSPENISRCHRALSSIERIKGNHSKAKAHLQKALEIAKKIGMPELEIEALLESGRLNLDLKQYKPAIQDANEVLKICSRTGFKFYEPDAELILARAYLAQKEIDKAKTFAQSALDKATEMHYHAPQIEAKQLLSPLK